MNTLIEANTGCLQQGIDFLKTISPEMYVHPCPAVFGSTIGGHFRHNLDHYTAFRRDFDTGSVDYDARDRDTAIETDPAAACALMGSLKDWFASMDPDALDRELRIRMDDGGDSTWSRTTARRELQFLLSHSIHHYALIVSIAARQGSGEFPVGFGVAPSTLQYRVNKGA